MGEEYPTAFEVRGYEHRPGWLKITQPAVLGLITLGAKIFQVKEKFGGLRIYIDVPEGISEEIVKAMDLLIEGAEHVCERTCEECGKDEILGYDYTQSGKVIVSAKLRTDRSYVQTLCDLCAESRKD
jgi:hypothetical protein